MVRDILAAIATTCPSVLLIAVFNLADSTTIAATACPLLAFGPAEWKGNIADMILKSTATSSSGALNRAQIIDCTRLSGLPTRTESLLLSPQGEKLLWVIAFACPPQQLRGKSGSEEWISALLKAPIITPV